MIKILINHKFKSMNEYINECRTNYYVANKTKQIELIFYWHIKTKTSDLDGRLPKNIIDGLVRSKRIPDDNVKYIQKITHIYIGDDKDYVEVEIKEIR